MHYSVKGTMKLIIVVILAKVMSSHRASGFITNISRSIHCQGSTATIDFDFNLQGDSIISGSKVWFFNQILIAQDIGSGFTALNNYTSRLTSHSSHGLTLSNVTTADSGTYVYEFFLAARLTISTATASLTVYIGPLAPSLSSGCSVNTSQSGNTVTCSINGNCGTPPLSPSWVNFTNTSNQFECTVKGTYQCCATSAALTSCYSGSPNDFCTTFDCASNLCKLEHGLGLGLGLGITCVIVCIVAVIIVSFIYKGDIYTYKLGLLLGLGLGITFQVAWIISTGNQWKLELGLGSGITCVIAYIVAVIIMFFVYKGQKNKTRDTWPPAFRLGTKHKVESETTRNFHPDEHRPLPPVSGQIENKQIHRPRPQPPEYNDLIDQHLRGLSAKYDDVQGLPNDMPTSNKLPPLLAPLQPAIEEDVALKEPKGKRKKKKQKEQLNEGEPEK